MQLLDVCYEAKIKRKWWVLSCKNYLPFSCYWNQIYFRVASTKTDMALSYTVVERHMKNRILLDIYNSDCIPLCCDLAFTSACFNSFTERMYNIWIIGGRKSDAQNSALIQTVSISDHGLFHFTFVSSLLGNLNLNNVTGTLSHTNLYSYKQNSQNIFISVPYNAKTRFSCDPQEWIF